MYNLWLIWYIVKKIKSILALLCVKNGPRGMINIRLKVPLICLYIKFHVRTVKTFFGENAQKAEFSISAHCAVTKAQKYGSRGHDLHTHESISDISVNQIAWSRSKNLLWKWQKKNLQKCNFNLFWESKFNWKKSEKS